MRKKQLEMLLSLKYGNADQVRWMHHWHLLQRILLLDIPGSVVEIGCNTGLTACFMQVAMERKRELHVYDSFEGMPHRTSEDDGTWGWVQSGVLAVSEQSVLDTFAKWDEPPPVIHKGWFRNTLHDQLPDQIAYAHLDGDLYESIKVSLEKTYPRLPAGAVCVVDDWAMDMMPGCKKACADFFQDKPEVVRWLFGSVQGYFIKGAP